jgi:hypothetical protein
MLTNGERQAEQEKWEHCFIILFYFLDDLFQHFLRKYEKEDEEEKKQIKEQVREIRVFFTKEPNFFFF